MGIQANLDFVKEQLPKHVTLVAVSKTKPISDVEMAYQCGQRVFGENKVQELCEKHEVLPKDISWHMIGHLQKNKVKYIAPFVDLIHSLDQESLAVEINKRAKQNDRVINCLLQVHLAQESTKFGFTFDECTLFLNEKQTIYPHIRIVGLMAMATFSSDNQIVEEEFKKMSEYYQLQQNKFPNLEVLSMGMSGDYSLAIKHNSNMVRIGSTIFGQRNYNK